MKLRVYDGARGRKERHQYENYIDRYSLYFPFTKRMMLEDYKEFGEHYTGDFLGFSFNSDGSVINRCTWDRWNLRYGRCDSLGKKVKIETLPKPVQDWIHGYERVWNNLISNPDNDKAIKEWNEYF